MLPLDHGGILNPEAKVLFCPTQTDFLTFRSPDGFGAVYLDLVEGIQALPDGRGSAVHLTNQVWYESSESVPELIARFEYVKKLRYSPRDEVPGQGLTTRSAPTSAESAPRPARPPIWQAQLPAGKE